MTTPEDLQLAWDQIDHSLADLKRFQLAEEIRKDIETDERRIQFKNQGNFDDATAPFQKLEAQQYWTDEWANKTYQIYCDVWELQGYPKTGNFLRAVFQKAVSGVIRSRTNAVIDEFENFGVRTNFPQEQLKAMLDEFRRSMQRLEARWGRKIEIEAKECELALRRTNQKTANVSSLPQKDIALKEKPPQADAGSDKSPRQNASLSDFDALAGQSFQEHLRSRAKQSRVSSEDLFKIAMILDGAKLLPPSKYLEQNARTQLAEYNSRHARRKPGPIHTWQQLVASRNRVLIRGMRRRLSRAAEKLRASLSDS